MTRSLFVKGLPYPGSLVFFWIDSEEGTGCNILLSCKNDKDGSDKT